MRKGFWLPVFIGSYLLSAVPGYGIEMKIYSYPAKNFCPAGLQPVMHSGFVSCGHPNQAAELVKPAPKGREAKKKTVTKTSKKKTAKKRPAAKKVMKRKTTKKAAKNQTPKVQSVNQKWPIGILATRDLPLDELQISNE